MVVDFSGVVSSFSDIQTSWNCKKLEADARKQVHISGGVQVLKVQFVCSLYLVVLVLLPNASLYEMAQKTWPVTVIRQMRLIFHYVV